MEKTFGLTRDTFGRLVLTLPDGVEHVGVVPARAFPIAEPTRWVSLCDKHGHELFAIDDLASVDPQIRRLLEEDLSRQEFLPIIRRFI
jgi:hypothetical protein